VRLWNPVAMLVTKLEQSGACGRRAARRLPSRLPPGQPETPAHNSAAAPKTSESRRAGPAACSSAEPGSGAGQGVPQTKKRRYSRPSWKPAQFGRRELRTRTRPKTLADERTEFIFKISMPGTRTANEKRRPWFGSGPAQPSEGQDCQPADGPASGRPRRSAAPLNIIGRRLSQLHDAGRKWLWLYCTAPGCYQQAPAAIAPFRLTRRPDGCEP